MSPMSPSPVSPSPVEQMYGLAKAGSWSVVRAAWAKDEALAMACARYVRTGSGWTFLHQAAYFGVEPACRDLVRVGADLAARAKDGARPADVAAAHGSPAISAFLAHAIVDGDLWQPSPDAALYPSSPFWDQASERRSVRAMAVAYGGGVVRIGVGARHYVDSAERTLVGWHGTFDPPRGMDGEALIDLERAR